ncbi:MAG: helix-turn-helix domain-containing protein [Elusimicrobiota bacterium]
MTPEIPYHDSRIQSKFAGFIVPQEIQDEWDTVQWVSGREKPPPPSPDKRYLTIQELAGYLGVSRWSLYKLVQRRSIPFIPLSIEEAGEGGKNLVRFDVQEIDKWMKRRAITPLRRQQSK